MRAPLAPLRDHITSEANRLSAKFPHLATALKTLEERSLSRFANEDLDFAGLQDALEAMVKDADELDTDGYLFAIAQQLTNQLDGMLRSALSEGVPVFPELEVTLKPKAGRQAEEDEPEPGFRTKLGGKPQWIQSDATPICEVCGKAMTFVAQIDSIAHQDTRLGQLLAKEESFMFADVGMIYVFWCVGCNVTQSVVQCG